MVKSTVTEDSPTGIVTVAGVVISLLSLLARDTSKAVSVGVLRVMVAVTVPSLSLTELAAISTVNSGLKSLSMMVRTVVFCSPILTPPVGLLRERLMVSSVSKMASSTMGMFTVLLVSPSAKLTVMGLFT